MEVQEGTTRRTARGPLLARSSGVQKKPFLLAAAGAVGLLAGYVTLVEPRWLHVHRPRIHLRRLPPDLEGLRIGLISDLHAGWTTPASVIRRAVRMLVAEAPDLVAITGDLVTSQADRLPDVVAELARLQAPLGVFAVPGNHDHVAGIDAWRGALARWPHLVDLTNASVCRSVGDAVLCVAGLDDGYEGAPRLRVPAPEHRDVTVVLAHGPDQAEHLRRRRDDVDLVLSGHTHGGQIRLPLLGAPVSSARNPELYEEGVRRRPWTQVYTSRGVGTVGIPARLLTRPEVSVLTLTAAPRPPR